MTAIALRNARMQVLTTCLDCVQLRDTRIKVYCALTQKVITNADTIPADCPMPKVTAVAEPYHA